MRVWGRMVSVRMWPKQRMAAIVYRVNQKKTGKIHRISQQTVRLPKAKQRLVCGWRPTMATSLVYQCDQFPWGRLCQKCFPNAVAVEVSTHAKRDDDAEAIEDAD